MKVYALCLEGYAERQVFQELQAKKYGLDLEIVSAVDGSLLSVEQLQYAANHCEAQLFPLTFKVSIRKEKIWSSFK